MLIKKLANLETEEFQRGDIIFAELDGRMQQISFHAKAIRAVYTHEFVWQSPRGRHISSIEFKLLDSEINENGEIISINKPYRSAYVKGDNGYYERLQTLKEADYNAKRKIEVIA